MNVILPVAGLGTRLRPHTYSRPKPLLSVAGKPILGHILDRLEALDVEQMVFIVGHLGEQIEAYVRRHYRFPARFVVQEELRGQAHAIRLARELVSGPVLILFVDTLTELDWAAVLRTPADGVVAVKEVEDPSRFGVITVEDGRVTRFVEKPDRPVSRLAVVGAYFLRDSRALFQAIDDLLERDIQTEGEYFLADALQILVDRGAHLVPQQVEVWEDCGTAEALLRANRYLLSRLRPGGEPGEGSVLIPPVRLEAGARIENSVVGPQVSVGAQAEVRDSRVGPYVSLGAGCRICRAVVQDSIVGEGAGVEELVIRDSLVGSEVQLLGGSGSFNVGDSSQLRPAGGRG